MIRVAQIDTGFTGNTMEAPLREGKATAVRVDKVGVVLTMPALQVGIPAPQLADWGHFFLAAAALCGEDI